MGFGGSLYAKNAKALKGQVLADEGIVTQRAIKVGYKIDLVGPTSPPSIPCIISETTISKGTDEWVVVWCRAPLVGWVAHEILEQVMIIKKALFWLRITSCPEIHANKAFEAARIS